MSKNKKLHHNFTNPIRGSLYLLIFFVGFFNTVCFCQNEPAANKTDEKGLKQGPWQGNYPSGKIRYTGFFTNDKPNGTFTHFFESGKTKTILKHTTDSKNAYAEHYFESGIKMSEGKYINQKKDSTWRFYHESGVLISEENYKDNAKEGLSKTFYDDGTLSEESNWKNNIKNGKTITYYSDGKPKNEIIYIDDKINGLFKFYYPGSNSIFISGMYENDLKNGIWMYFDEKGKATKKEIWENGVLVSTEELQKQ